MADLKLAGYSQRTALALLGVSRSTWHYRTQPRPRIVDPVAHRRRRSSLWLSADEAGAITEQIAAGFADRKSVFESYYEALDAGRPVASLSSWHRLARNHLESQRPVRRTRQRRTCAMPQFEADAVMQVWSWDITKMAGPDRGVNYNFYVVLDIFSRAIVGWRLEERESDALAADMLERAFAAHRVKPPACPRSGVKPRLLGVAPLPGDHLSGGPVDGQQQALPVRQVGAVDLDLVKDLTGDRDDRLHPPAPCVAVTETAAGTAVQVTLGGPSGKPAHERLELVTAGHVGALLRARGTARGASAPGASSRGCPVAFAPLTAQHTRPLMSSTGLSHAPKAITREQNAALTSTDTPSADTHSCR